MNDAERLVNLVSESLNAKLFSHCYIECGKLMLSSFPRDHGVKEVILNSALERPFTVTFTPMSFWAPLELMLFTTTWFDEVVIEVLPSLKRACAEPLEITHEYGPAFSGLAVKVTLVA